LCVQAPVSSGFKNAKELSGKRIVTSFPFLAKEFFAQYDTPENPTHIKYVSGSVEAACGLGLADAVIDLVETGTTMKAAGLEVVAEVLSSESVLISSKTSKHPEVVELIKKRIQGYMTASSYMMISYNILRENLAAAIKVTPGKRAPTVSALDNSFGSSEGEDAVAVSSLIPSNQSSKIMDQLVDCGATDILLLALSNSRM
jgi:ATP phosphoribosyltransferase